jgi:hypothetical protein
LLQTDLIEQIFPVNYIHRIPNFDAGFIRLVNQPSFQLESRQEDFVRGNQSKIHVQKFGDELLQRLVELQVARRENYEWYFVESKTAKLIMLYLAIVIGKTGEFTPSTDNIQNLDRSITQRGYVINLNTERQRLLNELIPYPVNPDLTRLRRFKDKYQEELKSFRILIEQAAFEIARIRFTRHREYLRDIKAVEINDKKEKILSDLNQSRLGQITFGTICGVTGALYGFSQDNKPLAIFSLANAIYSAFQGYDNRAALTRDYSYLALVDRQFNQNR